MCSEGWSFARSPLSLFVLHFFDVEGQRDCYGYDVWNRGGSNDFVPFRKNRAGAPVAPEIWRNFLQ
jgi:hypothetical protein